MPVEQCLEFVTAVGPDGSYPKGELRDYVVDEIDAAPTTSSIAE